jgi:hypothetical protein
MLGLEKLFLRIDELMDKLNAIIKNQTVITENQTAIADSQKIIHRTMNTVSSSQTRVVEETFSLRHQVEDSMLAYMKNEVLSKLEIFMGKRVIIKMKAGVVFDGILTKAGVINSLEYNIHGINKVLKTFFEMNNDGNSVICDPTEIEEIYRLKNGGERDAD